MKWEFRDALKEPPTVSFGWKVSYWNDEESCADFKRKPSYAAREDRREIQISGDGKPQSASLTAVVYAPHHDGEGIQFMHTGTGKSVCLGLDAAELKMD